MGRRQYLERLALGRSAYQDTEPEQPQRPAGVSSSTQEVRGHEYTQQYDSRGRPINSSIERFNAEQRKAQNEVLALVGVVERKHEADHNNGLRFDTIQQERRTLLAEEQDRGELLEYAAYVSSFLFHLWPDSFRQRIQVGLYAPGLSVTEILSTEWLAMWSGGTRLSLGKRFPGAGYTVAHMTARLLLLLGAEEIVGRLQKWINKSCPDRKRRESLLEAMTWVLDVLLLGIDVSLLPLEFHAAAQRLGLAPTSTIFPPRQSFFPWWWSTHKHIWNGRSGPRFMQRYTSPTAVFLMHRMIAYDAAYSVLPIFQLITDFRHPAIDDDVDNIDVPQAKRDPVGWVLYHCYSMRARFLQRSGWNLVKRNDTLIKRVEAPRSHEDEHAMHTRPVTAGKKTPIHRSTTMAQLPAQFLSDAIGAFFTRLLSLPLEAVMMRTIAASYMTSPGLKTTSGTLAAPRLYAPFGGGPIKYGWAAFAQYAGRVGLSLVLTAVVDVVLFHGIYSTVKSVGTSYFYWGREGSIGHVIYTKESFDKGEDEEQTAGQVH